MKGKFGGGLPWCTVVGASRPSGCSDIQPQHWCPLRECSLKRPTTSKMTVSYDQFANQLAASQITANDQGDTTWPPYGGVGGYTACGIPLVQSTNRNGNRIPLNGTLFLFVSVKKTFCKFRFYSFLLKQILQVPLNFCFH